VYVATDYIMGRETERVNRNKPKTCPHCGEAL